MSIEDRLAKLEEVVDELVCWAKEDGLEIKMGKEAEIAEDILTPYFYKYCSDCGKSLHADYAKLRYLERNGHMIWYTLGKCIDCGDKEEAGQ